MGRIRRSCSAIYIGQPVYDIKPSAARQFSTMSMIWSMPSNGNLFYCLHTISWSTSIYFNRCILSLINRSTQTLISPLGFQLSSNILAKSGKGDMYTECEGGQAITALPDHETHVYVPALACPYSQTPIIVFPIPPHTLSKLRLVTQSLPVSTL